MSQKPPAAVYVDVRSFAEGSTGVMCYRKPMPDRNATTAYVPAELAKAATLAAEINLLVDLNDTFVEAFEKPGVSQIARTMYQHLCAGLAAEIGTRMHQLEKLDAELAKTLAKGPGA